MLEQVSVNCKCLYKFLTVSAGNGLTWAGFAITEVNVHIVALTWSTTILRGRAGTETCSLPGPTSTGNTAGSPAHP